MKKMESSNSTNVQKLQVFLRNLFNYDPLNLDFGIDRILNFKRAEINQFVDNEISQILTESAKSFQLSKGEPSPDGRICDWLIDFFSCYSKGKFISNYGISRAHISSSFMKSEGVILSWSTHDQYYVKTAKKSKISTDYFIHRNLRDFLIKELEYYITKNIIHSDKLLELTNEKEFTITEQYLKTIQIFKQITLKIINILSDIEDLKKKLWEKPKFIVKSDYCITLDYIEKDFYPEILQNNYQIAEWEKNHFLSPFPTKQENSIDYPSFLDRASEKNLQYMIDHPSLMIDTKFFSSDFKYRILNRIPNLDDNTVGILIHSDNFHALKLLQSKYRHKINCCYIDPPFNARSSKILYKNTFKHSSWLTLIANRLELTHSFLAPQDGVLIVAIDENEQERLGLLLESTFPQYLRTCVSVVHNPGGIQGKNFAYSNEYAYFIYPPDGKQIGMENREDSADVRNFMNTAKGNTTNYLRTAGPNCFYPVLIKDGEIVGFGDVCPLDYHPIVNIIRSDGIVEVYPVDHDGVERKWVFARKSVEKIHGDLSAKYSQKHKTWHIIRTKSWINYKTVWNRKKYVAKTYGTQLLNQILGKAQARFSFPKSLHLVEDCLSAGLNTEKKGIILDYFAGSGTTGHAVLNLNAQNGTQHQFILVEMGHYFDGVLKQRLINRIFSDTWKTGRPQPGNALSKQILKYYQLEQYEDSIYNFSLEPEDENGRPQLEFLEHPFTFELNIARGDKTEPVKIDLVETFNNLAGIWVSSIEKKHFNEIPYVIVRGKRKDHSCIAIWRDKPEDIDLLADKLFITDNIIKNQTYNEIFLNWDSIISETIPNATSMEEIFNQHLNGQ
ncbi:MAG: DNA methyltransferase [Promethearchaeota archaeon]